MTHDELVEIEAALLEREELENARFKAVCDTLCAIARGFAGAG